MSKSNTTDRRHSRTGVLGRNESQLFKSPDRQWGGRLFAAIAAVGIVAICGLLGGVFGVAAGIITVLVWGLLGTPAAIAVGAIAVVTLPEDARLPPAEEALASVPVADGLLGVSALVFLVLLLGTAFAAPSVFGHLVSVILGALVLGGIAGALLLTSPLWVALLVSGLAVVLACYTAYRVHLLRLGLLGVGPEQTGDDEAAEMNAPPEPTGESR